MNLINFKEKPFLQAIKELFNELNVPVNSVDDKPTSAKDILKDTYKENTTFQLVNEVYFVGMVDDAAFNGIKSENVPEIKADYDGILIFGVTLNQRENNLLPTRSQLAEISRAFNREFYYTPVVVVFKYADDTNNYIAFANTERLKYKQEWREGEKAGKVSLLRDINIENQHRGHEDIIDELCISKTGKKAVDSFAKLYAYWQDVFNVSVLNKRFYKELQIWYFWAIKEVTFPNTPKIQDEGIDGDQNKYDEAVNEHKGKNVIRLLTRILFIWFIKEKKLIPPEIFEETFVRELIKDFTAQKLQDVVATGKHMSMYYRAILQNLFFATLNQEKDKREFRKDNTHMNVTNLMRYKDYFRDGGAEEFVTLMKAVVPFMNGGLFECLDKPHPELKGPQGGDVIIYQDGFSDRNDNELQVPDFLFFAVEEEVDISGDVGLNGKAYKQAKTRGLLKILNSYKFTIAENTPIEEEVALDPELLGKVFENLLASYNPETKTTARKQTGSFYTPREIVNYMVDESLIAYLKNAVNNWHTSDEQQIDADLHTLIAFDNPQNPFEDEPQLQSQIIKALDTCKILDPACGSGAFPMGILQKMVHILHKIDPNNEEWKSRQIERVNEAIEKLEAIDDANFREGSINELKKQISDIEESFVNNELDYGRKLYLIENCIYGVDIQSIAIQISKLRFFISLVVDQRIDKDKTNFGVRPLPNLETKFVAANTLIGIGGADRIVDDDKTIKKLRDELKSVRHKIFSVKNSQSKKKYRKRDKELREKIAEELRKAKWGEESDVAQKLAYWDPYDQNASSPFFDPEWMFGIANGFDVVIGNPPYIKEYTDKSTFAELKGKKYYQGKMDIWYYFACTAIDQLGKNGMLCFIAPNNWTTNAGASIMRNKVIKESQMIQLVDFGSYMIFESAAIQTMILLTRKANFNNYKLDYRKIEKSNASIKDVSKLLNKEKGNFKYENIEIIKGNWVDKNLNFENKAIEYLLEQIKIRSNFVLDSKKEVAQGIVSPQDFLNKKGQQLLGESYSIGEGVFNISHSKLSQLDLLPIELELIRPFYTSNELGLYYGNNINQFWVIYTDSSFKNAININPYPNIKKHLDRFAPVITSDNKPYGLHRARNEYFFKGEKIISLRKCARPTFTYTDFDCYVSQTFFVIKSERINQKYLTAIFNSHLITFWLWHRGKLQGDFYQVDKEPILNIPICNNADFVLPISILVSLILYLKSIGSNSSIIERVIDGLVFNLYFPDHMQEKEIDVIEYVEQDLKEVLADRDFEHLSDSKKQAVVEQLLQCWSNPENEVVKRMAQFKTKSPDILKPILES